MRRGLAIVGVSFVLSLLLSADTIGTPVPQWWYINRSPRSQELFAEGFRHGIYGTIQLIESLEAEGVLREALPDIMSLDEAVFSSFSLDTLIESIEYPLQTKWQLSACYDVYFSLKE